MSPSKLHDTLKLHMQNTNIIHHIFYVPLLHPSFIIKIDHIYYKVQFVYLHICMQKKNKLKVKANISPWFYFPFLFFSFYRRPIFLFN